MLLRGIIAVNVVCFYITNDHMLSRTHFDKLINKIMYSFCYKNYIIPIIRILLDYSSLSSLCLIYSHSIGRNGVHKNRYGPCRLSEQFVVCLFVPVKHLQLKILKHTSQLKTRVWQIKLLFFVAKFAGWKMISSLKLGKNHTVGHWF